MDQNHKKISALIASGFLIILAAVFIIMIDRGVFDKKNSEEIQKNRTELRLANE
jgi:hypothetical protein